MLHNAGSAPLDLELALTGADAAQFTLKSPPSGRATLAAQADLSITLALTTNDAALPQAPAQDDGATVLSAALKVSGGKSSVTLESYALVLTYVELEPTFGQILGAFPQWTTKLPAWLENDANPNPGSPLPGPVPNTDEVSGSTFRRLDASRPITLLPLARFSPPGLVPFGW